MNKAKNIIFVLIGVLALYVIGYFIFTATAV